MSDIIFYATKDDARVIRDWINTEPEVAWIVKVSETNHRYRWRAVFELEQIAPETSIRSDASTRQRERPRMNAFSSIGMADGAVIGAIGWNAFRSCLQRGSEDKTHGKATAPVSLRA